MPLYSSFAPGEFHLALKKIRSQAWGFQRRKQEPSELDDPEIERRDKAVRRRAREGPGTLFFFFEGDRGRQTYHFVPSTVPGEEEAKSMQYFPVEWVAISNLKSLGMHGKVRSEKLLEINTGTG